MEGRMKGGILLVMVFVALFGGLAAFGYLLYSLRDTRPGCTCEMVKNRECAP